MAEIAGLVVGGIALASLFDTCMSTFDRVDAGINCGKEYQDAALKITLLGRHLAQWEESYKSNQPPSTRSDGLLAEATLQNIQADLDKLCRTSERYKAPAQTASNAIATVTNRVQTLTISGKVKTKVGSKIVWALRDKDRVNVVISSIKFKLDELDSLLNTLAGPERHRIAAMQAEQIVEPFLLEASGEAIPALQACASAVDPDFGHVLKAATGHKYGKLFTKGSARLNAGDYIAAGYTGPFLNAQNKYGDINTEGEARVNAGTNYGGKSVFDD